MNEPTSMPSNPLDQPTQVVSGELSAPILSGARRYGRFAVQRFHAKGGLGEVHVATDEELRREVALKRMQDRCAGDPAARRRFLNEAEITARLEHPGIVPIYGLVQDENGQPCYAMRFIEGESLAEAIKRFHNEPAKDEPPAKHEPPGLSRRDAAADGGDKPRRSSDYASLAFRQLLQRFISVCNTIAYAHSKFVIHRDIKPANVMLGPFGETLVVDWGLAREVPVSRDAESSERSAEEDPLPAKVNFEPFGSDTRICTQAGQALGTLGYMAPEQAGGRWKIVGPRSDVYSLGATLYEMLTGHRPVRGSDPLEALQKAQAGDFPAPRHLNPSVPKALEGICLKAMAMKPEDRYAAAKDLAADVEHWLADEPLAAWQEPWSIRLRRWRRRHRTLVTSGTVAAVLIAVGLVVGIALLGAANSDLRAANARAEKNAERATRAQEQAEQAFGKAKEAVDKYLKEIADDPQLNHTPGLHDLRQRLLQAAVPFFTWFTEQRPTEPQLQADQGWAFGRLGNVERELGDHTAALAHYKRHCDIDAALVTEHPHVPEFHSDFGGALHNQANELESQGKREEARQLLEQAVVEQQKALQADPRETHFRAYLANHNNSLGSVLLAMGQREPARHAFGRARELCESLVAEFPSVPVYYQYLATSHFGLGLLLSEMGERHEAEQAYRRALEIRSKLSGAFPEALVYREELAKSYHSLAVLLDGLGQRASALEAFREAIGLYERLAGDFPAVPAYRRELAAAHQDLANLSRTLGQQGAEEHLRQAVQLYQKLAADYPAVPVYRQELANTLDNFGNLLKALGDRRAAEHAYRQAIEIQERLAADFADVRQYRRDLAASYNNLSLLLRELGQRPAAEQACRHSLDLLERLAAEFPAVPAYRHELARGHSNLGRVLRELGQRRAAERAFRRALDLHNTLASEFPKVPEYRRQLAGTYDNLGALLADVDEPAAEQAYGRALQLLETLAGEFPGVPAYRHELARSRLDRGMLLKDLGQRSSALAELRQAMDILQNLAADFPAMAAYREDLASCHTSSAMVLAALNQGPAAEQAYRAALDIFEQLTADFPAVPQYQQSLATAHNNYASLLKANAQWLPAEQHYRRALEIREKLAAAIPNVPEYRLALAASCVNLGHLLRDQGQAESSLTWFDKAIGPLEAMLEQEPRLVTERLFLRNAHWGRAQALDKLGRHAEAIMDWNRTVSLNAIPAHGPDLRSGRAASLARAGEHAKAVAEANALAEGKDVTAEMLYNLAGVCALAAAAVTDDAKLADQYAARAVELLRQAIANGYKDIEHLKKDDDLKALRERADFRKLLKDLEEKNQP